MKQTKFVRTLAVSSVVVVMGLVSGCNQKLQTQVDDLTRKVSTLEAQINQMNSEMGQVRQIIPQLAAFKTSIDQLEASAKEKEAHKKKH